MLQLISLLVENKPGALMRVTGVLSARGYNIESLTVARTLDPELSRMSIVVDIDSSQRAQVIKQINKLVNVLQVSDLTEGSAVRRELVLLWIGTTQENRMTVLKEAEIFGAESGGQRSGRIRPGGHWRSRKAGCIYPHHAAVWRNRSDPVGPGFRAARGKESETGAAGAQRTFRDGPRGPKNHGVN